MYNLKYRYVVVRMDKNDYMLYQLIKDLENWTTHLYPVELEKSIEYKGLVPLKEFEHLMTLVAMSPYGAGYCITVDKVPLRDYGMYPWRRKVGLV